MDFYTSTIIPFAVQHGFGGINGIGLIIIVALFLAALFMDIFIRFLRDMKDNNLSLTRVCFYPAHMILRGATILGRPLWRPARMIYGAINSIVPVTVLVRRAMFAIATPSNLQGAIGGRYAAIVNSIRGYLLGQTTAYERALLANDYEAAAEIVVPRSRFSWLWSWVPPDLVRDPWDDGVLVNGRPISDLADYQCTDSLIDKCIEGGFVSGIATAIAVLIMVVLVQVGCAVIPDQLAAFGLLHQAVDPLASFVAPAGDDWGFKDVTPMGVGFTFATVADAVMGFLAQVLPAVTAIVLLSVGVMLTMTVTTLKLRMMQYAQPYLVPTKDALTLAKSRAADRQIAIDRYAERVVSANTWLKDSAIYYLGEAMGVARARGDLSAPRKGNPVNLDFEGVSQGISVFGGIGSGKSRYVFASLCRQFLINLRMGMYGTCAKGVLPYDLLPIIEDVGRMADVRMIGTEIDQWAVDFLDGLTPAEALTLMEVVARQIAKATDDGIWQPMAADDMGHSTVLAFAWERTPEGQRWMEQTNTAPYSLWAIFLIACSPTFALQVARDVRKGLSNEEAYRQYGYRYDSDTVRASVDYMTTEWQTMAFNTRSGIIANVRAVWGKMVLSEKLRDKFFRGLATNILPMSEALNGKLLLSTLNPDKDGPAARLQAMLQKERLYFDARCRQRRIGSKACWAQPCVAFIDEAQQLACADPFGVAGDVSFANISRSTGLTLCMAFQGAAALYYSLGKEAADNLLVCLRNKLVLSIEDVETFEMVRKLSGKSWTVKASEQDLDATLEERALSWGGWTPVSVPVGAYERDVTPADFAMLRDVVLDPSAIVIGKPVTRTEWHGVDYSNVPPAFVRSMSGPQDNITSVCAARAQAQAQQQQKEHQLRTTGVEERDVFTDTDVIQLSHGYAWAFWQRAGGSMRDLIKLPRPE